MHGVRPWLVFALLTLAACAPEERPLPASDEARSEAALRAVAARTEIEIPAPLRGLAVGPDDAMGQPAVIPCGTCHELPDAAMPLPSAAVRIAGPHRGLTVEHGTLVCASCHHPTRRDALRLADSRTIPLVEAMQLCAQCHGPQARAYAHGAHGGMRGYYDTERGVRVRNHCVSCHDPHAPNFGSFRPMPRPRDRFLPAPEGGVHE